MSVRLIVRASWDDEAKVWVATSDDVPGLTTAAESLDALVPKLQLMIPELLDANGFPDSVGLRFDIRSVIPSIPVPHAWRGRLRRPARGHPWRGGLPVRTVRQRRSRHLVQSDLRQAVPGRREDRVQARRQRRAETGGARSTLPAASASDDLRR